MPATKEEKVKYLRKRLDYLRECNADIENRLRDDGDEFIKICDDERACNKYLWHLETVVCSTFRYAMFMAVCTFLEESVKFICDLTISDYATKLKTHRRGNWLAKHRQLLADSINPAVDLLAIKTHLDTMEEFVAVRNCIVHEWGKVDGDIDGLINKDDEKREADCCFGRWADGFLRLTDQAVPTAVIASGRIVNKLLQDLLGFPGHCVY